MDKLIKDLTRSERSSERPPLLLVCGNDSSWKIQLAAKLAHADKPAEFDAANGLVLLGSDHV